MYLVLTSLLCMVRCDAIAQHLEARRSAHEHFSKRTVPFEELYFLLDTLLGSEVGRPQSAQIHLEVMMYPCICLSCVAVFILYE